MKKTTVASVNPSRLDGLNRILAAAGKELLPSDTTYLDYAKSVEGSKGAEEGWIEDTFVEEGVGYYAEDWSEDHDVDSTTTAKLFSKLGNLLLGLGRVLTGGSYRGADDIVAALTGPEYFGKALGDKARDTYFVDRPGLVMDMYKDIPAILKQTSDLGIETDLSNIPEVLIPQALRPKAEGEEEGEKFSRDEAPTPAYEYPDSPAYQEDLRISKEAMKEREYYDEIPDGAPIEEYTKKANFHEIDRVRRWALGVFKSNFEAAIYDRSEEWEGWEQAYWSADTNARDTLREVNAEEEFPGIGPENIAAGIAEANSDHRAHMAIFRTELQEFTSRYGGKDPELQAWTEDYFNNLAEQYPDEYGDPRFLYD